RHTSCSRDWSSDVCSSDLLIADGVVILAAGVAFGPELALYGLLAVFLTMRVVDLLEEGAPYVKAALIVTDVAEEISAKIISDLGRGVTSMPAQGMYTKQDRNLLFVTLYQDQRSEGRRVGN